MRGLTIVIASAEEVRVRSAMGLALSYAAVGGAVRFFLDTAAVRLLRPPIRGDEDDRWRAIGFPDLAGLFAETLDAGVALSVCQAGLADAALSLADLDPRIAANGMIGLLASLGDDRLVVV